MSLRVVQNGDIVWEIILLTISGDSNTNQDNKSIEIIIDKNGKYFINKDGQTNPIEIENLGALLQGVKEVTISGDKELKYQVIMDTVSKVKNAGVENLGINFYE